MNKLIIALGLTLATSTAALAQSSALDVYDFPAVQGSIALATGVVNDQVEQSRFGDGSPVYTVLQDGVDFTTTASIDDQASVRTLGISPRAL